MQHQLIDIFLQDRIQHNMEPRYQSGLGTEDILVMQKDSSYQSDVLREPDNAHYEDTTIPLFPIGERWKPSWRTPPGIQRRLEQFFVNCILSVEEKKVDLLNKIAVDQNGHLVCSWDMKRHRDRLGDLIFERKIVYLRSLPKNCVVSLPEVEYTGLLADQEKEGVRSIGSFIMKTAINRYRYIGSEV